MKLDSSVGCFIILLSILGGFLTADPLLNASGLVPMFFENHMEQMRVMCWFVIFIFASVLIIFGMRTALFLTSETVGVLRNSAVKPGLPVAITLIIAGTICLLGVVGLEFLALATAPQFPGIRSTLTSQVNNANGVVISAVGMNSEARIFAHFFSALIFLAGSALISLGIWSSIPKPPAPAPAPIPSDI